MKTMQPQKTRPTKQCHLNGEACNSGLIAQARGDDLATDENNQDETNANSRAKMIRRMRSEKLSKNVSHIIGLSLSLTGREAAKGAKISHLTQRECLSGGVGLVLWFIKTHSAECNGESTLALSSRFAERLCPRARGEKSVTELLKKFGALEIVAPGIPDISSTRYKLADKWRGVLPRNFKLNDWQKKRLREAHEFARKTQLIRRPWLDWVDETLRRTELPETEALRQAMQNEETSPAATQALKFLRDYEPPHKKKKTEVKYCGTVYTPIASLPKKLLGTLLIDGERVSQLDITSAHPSTLPSLMVEAEKKFQVAGAIAESKKLADGLETGKLYETLGLETGLEPKAAKKELLAALNGEDNHTYNSKVFRAFAKKYPVARKVISMIRAGDRKNLNKKMAKALAAVIERTLETLFKFKIPTFPRTDEIVCRKKDEAFVREVLSAYFLDQTRVHALVGGKRVSFLPDGFMEKPHCESLRTPCLINAE